MKKLIVCLMMLTVYSGNLMARTDTTVTLRKDLHQFPFYNTTFPVAERVASLVSLMTLEEKVAQMQNNAPAIERLGVPAYNWWNECLHGVARNGVATVFPQAIGMAATWNPALIRREAAVIATEARAKYREAKQQGYTGIYQGLTFWSPNINIFRDPRWGRGQETYGEDPFLTGRMGVAFVKGLQGDDPEYYNVVATAKHYAVHSGPEATRHSFDAWCSERDLFETYLPAFEALVREAKVASVMGAYNRFWGEPCSASDFLLDQILRKRWGFKGYVTTDCGTIWDIYRGHALQPDSIRASVLALKAGSDLTCGNEYAGLPEAVRRGYIPVRLIDQAVTRLFTARFKLGMFDPDDKVVARIPEGKVSDASHRALALEVARESMVLLKNDRGVLPLSGKTRSILLTGPFADNLSVLLGNYHGTPSAPVTILAGLKERCGDSISLRYAHSTMASDSLQKLALAVDVVIYAGGISPEMEGEELDVNMEGFYRGDRTTLDLPASQGRTLAMLAQTGKPVVLVLTNGSALSINHENEIIPAILEAWYPGEAGGRAVAEVLFGDYNPAGRLPVTFYRSVNDLPPFEDYSMAGRTYRYFKGEPLFPFGHGLSYTRFEYLKAIALQPEYHSKDTVMLHVTVKNTGKIAGDEVVQVYMSHGSSAYPAPRTTLVGFKRLQIKPGQSEVCAIPIPVQTFRSYNPETDSYFVAPGNYTLSIGASSNDIRLKTEILVIL